MLKCHVYVFCSPKSSTAVLASFCWASSDFPLSHFGLPPNMVTCVHPGSKLKAVVVCHRRDCASPRRVSWGEIRTLVLFWAHGKNSGIELESEPQDLAEEGMTSYKSSSKRSSKWFLLSLGTLKPFSGQLCYFLGYRYSPLCFQKVPIMLKALLFNCQTFL